MRGATCTIDGIYGSQTISTHAPHARCNVNTALKLTAQSYFYSRTSCEVQHECLNGATRTENFYSRTSCEVQHNRKNEVVQCPLFLLTHLMRGATSQSTISSISPCISTHAPHARCNTSVADCALCCNNFYSRTSCEVQPFRHSPFFGGTLFLLTHLMRGATRFFSFFAVAIYFYSRTSCEVQLESAGIITVTNQFLLTHLMRGATYSIDNSTLWRIFLLTHLMRGATSNGLRDPALLWISTHAPHARCNPIGLSDKMRRKHFYSRTSCEVQRF